MAIDTNTSLPTASFQDLPISHSIYKAVADLGWHQPTPIQSLALPALLRGEDVVGLAQTGSGKTGAFGIPLIESVDPDVSGVQALVLVPTRELAAQVSADIKALGKYERLRSVMICGGVGMGGQFEALRRRPQVVVGTPGRILDHMGRGTLRLDSVHYLVIDEADRMLDMGFEPDVKRILSQVPVERQTALFSATMPAQIRSIVNRYMRSPEWLAVESETRTVETVEQVYYHVSDRDKTRALRSLIDAEEEPLVIVFRRTQRGATKLHLQLERDGYKVGALHGGMSQGQRTRTLQDFTSGRLRVLIATNLASRGLDIPHVSHVINYDLPEDSETYVHRIGRTARAGRTGVAATLVGESDIVAFEQMQRKLPTEVREERLAIYNHR